MVRESEEVCLACSGYGYAMDGLSKCLHCGGNGYIGKAYGDALRKKGFGDSPLKDDESYVQPNS